MRDAFIRDHEDQLPVELACKVLEASRSGYYARKRRPLGTREVRRGELVAPIRQAHRESRATYGSPRVPRGLKARGAECCEDTVARLMRRGEARSKAVRRFRVRTNESRRDHPVAENVLNREFHPDRPDQVWTGDMTSIPTAKGWLTWWWCWTCSRGRWWAGRRPIT